MIHLYILIGALTAIIFLLRAKDSPDAVEAFFAGLLWPIFWIMFLISYLIGRN